MTDLHRRQQGGEGKERARIWPTAKSTGIRANLNPCCSARGIPCREKCCREGHDDEFANIPTANFLQSTRSPREELMISSARARARLCFDSTRNHRLSSLFPIRWRANSTTRDTDPTRIRQMSRRANETNDWINFKWRRFRGGGNRTRYARSR
jgi:hypothetical protein